THVPQPSRLRDHWATMVDPASSSFATVSDPFQAVEIHIGPPDLLLVTVISTSPGEPVVATNCITAPPSSDVLYVPSVTSTLAVNWYLPAPSDFRLLIDVLLIR